MKTWRDYYYNNLQKAREYAKEYSRKKYADPITGPIMRQERNVRRQKLYAKERMEMINLLGGRCSNKECLVPGGCTDIRCLQIDHIEGGGKKEYAILGPNLIHYYLTHRDKLSKIQLLCANCNWIKVSVNKELPRKYNAL